MSDIVANWERKYELLKQDYLRASDLKQARMEKIIKLEYELANINATLDEEHERRVAREQELAEAVKRSKLQHEESVRSQRELAAAQAALAQVQLDKAEYDALKAKLARYEQVEMPDGENVCSDCGNRIGNLVCDTCKMTWIEALRTRLAAQKVRADENERDAKLYKYLRERVEIRNIEAMNGTRRPGLSIVSGMTFFDSKTVRSKERIAEQAEKLDAAIDQAIKEQA